MRRPGLRLLTVALALAGAALLTGCGEQKTDETATDDKGSGPRPHSTPHIPSPRGSSPAPGRDPERGQDQLPVPSLVGQTSTPDPKLPAPVVNMDIAHDSETKGRTVNLTIDDGPDPVWTPKILKILRDNDAKAVFCMVGPQAEAHPDLVQRVVAEGHRLCDHSVAHNTGMDHRSRDYQKDQILRAAAQIEKASGGVKPLYYRAPGGAFTPYSRQIAAAAGMRPVGWNVDSKDFELPGAEAILRTVKGELANGPTVLFHDGGGDRSQTAAAMKKLLPWLSGKGYAFSFPVR
ncbi:polysaccharide deacetylase family protein [Streptomyces sp. NPDC087850]|uniref:polysaccharide deacetylase family protein n=1 Tax=Streptomyces sp. NPDC087850 TaxID=3365809 RepID=UPI0038167AB4